MPNTGCRVLEDDSIFGIFKLSFPFPFTLVRHRMELTINHFIQNISNSIERTHWILTSVSPMTTTFLETQKIKINQLNIQKKISKYFKSSNFDDRIFLTVVRLSWLSFLSRRFSSSSSDDSLLPRTKSNPVSSLVLPNPMTRSKPEKSFAISDLLAGTSSSRMIPSTNLKGFSEIFLTKNKSKNPFKEFYNRISRTSNPTLESELSCNSWFSIKYVSLFAAAAYAKYLQYIKHLILILIFLI